MVPLGCLPLWGSEGVSLIAFPNEWRVTGFLQSQKNIKKVPVSWDMGIVQKDWYIVTTGLVILKNTAECV
jgi:hypothetical protein